MRALNRLVAALGMTGEARAKGNFTERRLSAFETAATGADAIATGVAAVEIASGFYGRDLSLAEVSPRNARTAAITPSWLSLAGRELARSGQFVCDLEVRGGRVALVPASSAFAVQGTSDPSSWVWVLTLFGPGDTTTRFRPNDGILSVTIGNTVTRPLEGRAPWQAASLSGRLLSGIEKQLAGEAQSRKLDTSSRSPTLETARKGEDDDGETDPLTTLRRDLAGAEGRTMLAPSYGLRDLVADQASRHLRRASTRQRDSARILPQALTGIETRYRKKLRPGELRHPPELWSMPESIRNCTS